MPNLPKLAASQTGIPEVSVIFVHGSDGHFSTTWLNLAQGKTFFQLIAEEYPNWDIYSVDYDAAKWKTSGDPVDTAEAAKTIFDLITRANINGPIVFVCHSWGGIIVKKLIEQAFANRHLFLVRVGGIIFLATPHLGSQLASIVLLVMKLFRIPTWFATGIMLGLRYKERTLIKLQEVFSSFLDSYPVPVQCLIEGRRYLGLFFVSNRASSAINDTRVENHVLKEDHYSICKPASKEAGAYILVAGFIRDKVVRANPDYMKIPSFLNRLNLYLNNKT